MNTKSTLLSALLGTLLLAACGGGMSGTYEGGLGSITFESGKADVNLMGATREMEYSVEGKKILLHSAAGNLVLTRNQDGSIDTPWGHMKPKS